MLLVRSFVVAHNVTNSSFTNIKCTGTEYPRINRRKTGNFAPVYSREYGNVCLTSSKLGKPPVDSLEKRSWPLTVISKLAENGSEACIIHNPSRDRAVFLEGPTFSSDASLDLGVRNRGADLFCQPAEPALEPSSTTTNISICHEWNEKFSSQHVSVMVWTDGK